MVSQQGGGGGGGSSYANLVNLLSGQAPGTSATPPPMLALLTNRPAGPVGTNNSANAVEHDLLGNGPVAQHPANAPVPMGGPAGPIDPYSGMDPAQMAANEFAPQYALLDQLAQQQRAQYTNSGNTIGSMWDALSKATMGQEKGIKNNYASAGSAIGKAYNDATAATDNAYSSSRNQIAALAQRLGVSAAVPSALQQGADHQGILDALIKNSGASYQGLNAILGNNEVDFNRNSANIDTQAGINARQSAQSQLAAALMQLGNQRLALAGKQGAAQNQYGLDISKGRQTSQDAAAKLAEITQNDQAQAMLGEARLKQQADQFAAQQAANGNKNLSATEYLAQLANEEYGGNLLAATNAKNAVLDTIAQGDGNKHSWNSAADFVNSVMNRNPNSKNPGGDYRQLQQLALDYYTRLVGAANKPL